MKHKKMNWGIVFLFSFCLTGLQAQNTMFVNERSGTQTPFTFTSIKKLTFATGNLTVNKINGSTSAYALTNIRNLNFGSIAAIVDVNNEESLFMFLFPNPVTDQLHIRYYSATSGNVELQIMDVQGKVIFQQTLSSHNGTNFISFPVAQFQNGLYLCCLQNGNKLQTNKFVKY